MKSESESAHVVGGKSGVVRNEDTTSVVFYEDCYLLLCEKSAYM